MSLVLTRLGPQLVSNWHFDNNNGVSDFDDWTEQISGSSTINVDVGGGWTGDACRFDLDVSSSFVQIYQDVGAADNVSFRTKFRAKVSDDAGSNHLQVAVGGGSSVNQSLSTAWQEYSLDLLSATGDDNFYLGRGSSVASDSIYLDNAKLWQLYGEVTLPNPSFGNRDPRRRLQAFDESPGGQAFVYDRGVSKLERVFAWNGTLLTPQKEALETFFDDVAVGMKNLFQVSWTDWRPSQFGGTGGEILIESARFARPQLDFQEIRNGHWVVELVLREDDS